MKHKQVVTVMQAVSVLFLVRLFTAVNVVGQTRSEADVLVLSSSGFYMQAYIGTRQVPGTYPAGARHLGTYLSEVGWLGGCGVNR